MNNSTSFFHHLGLRRVINAAGKMTALGASTQSSFVRAAMYEGAQNFVDLGELMAVADRQIAQATGAEGGFITSCSAAGITLATAACLTRGDLARTERLPLPPGPPNEMIVQAGHAVHFGASLTQVMRLAGARVQVIGTVNRTLPHQVEQAINANTAGIMFVVSHHTHPTGFVPIEMVVRIAHAKQVPVVVDAAAELDLRKFIAAGADLVIYSGHKSLNAPTSGIVAGRRDLIDACHQQNSGIGRTMKIGKENIIGCLAALHEYINESETSNDAARAEAMLPLLAGIKGLRAEAVRDPTRPTIARVRLILVTGQAKLTARQLITKLEAHSPSIRTRNHAAEQGEIEIDFRPLAEGDEAVIAAAVWHYLG